MKKFLAAIMSVVMIMAYTPMIAFADEEAAPTSGPCGEGVSYALVDGTMTISGTGAMDSYGVVADIPWKDLRSDITKVVVGDGVTNVGETAFYQCTNLESVELAGSVTSIETDAFNQCSKLASIKIPAGLTTIGSTAFSGCGFTTAGPTGSGCDYEFPWTTSIPDNAFRGCSKLTGVEIPSGVTSIGIYAFYGCSSLTGIEIPVGVTSIGNDTFERCSGLTSIDIPSGVATIGSAAFKDCSNLAKITVPASVTKVSNNAFAGCPLETAGPTGSDCDY